MAPGARTLRSAGLIATGAVAVHELRYLAAGSAAAGAGHGYLPVAGLLSTILLGAACAQLAAAVERARRTGSAERPRGVREETGFVATWLFASLALVLIFFCQELLEAVLAGGHGAELGAVVAGDAWVALPMAMAVGALLALGQAGARSAVAAAVRRGRRTATRRRSLGRPEPARGHRASGRLIARNLAGRAPPRAVS